jgi:hypothetical protein
VQRGILLPPRAERNDGDASARFAAAARSMLETGQSL